MRVDRDFIPQQISEGDSEPLLQETEEMKIAQEAHESGFAVQAVGQHPKAPFRYEINLGGFKISGLDPAALDSGDLRVSLPMQEGKHRFPALYKDAEVVVAEKAKAEVLVNVTSNNTTLPVVSSIAVQFDPPLVIDNPKQAFDAPSENAFLRFIHWDEIVDYFADIVLFGITFDESGNMHLEGYLDKGCLGKQPLDELMKGKTPHMNSNIGALMQQGLSGNTDDMHLFTTPNAPRGEFPDVSELVKRLGGMLERGTYALHVETKDMQIELDMESEKVHIATPKGPVAVQISGTLKLDKNGDVEVTADVDKSSISGPAGRVNLGGEAHLADMMSLNPDALAHVEVSADMGMLQGDLKPTQDFKIGTFQVQEHGILGGGHLFIHRQATGEVAIMDASSVSLFAQVGAKNASLDFGMARAECGDLELKAKVEAGISLGEKGFSVQNGRADMSFHTAEPTLYFFDTNAQVGASIDARMDTKHLDMKDNGEKIAVDGSIVYTLEPTEKLREVFPGQESVNRQIDYTINEQDGFQSTPPVLGQLSEDVPLFLVPNSKTA